MFPLGLTPQIILPLHVLVLLDSFVARLELCIRLFVAGQKRRPPHPGRRFGMGQHHQPAGYHRLGREGIGNGGRGGRSHCRFGTDSQRGNQPQPSLQPRGQPPHPAGSADGHQFFNCPSTILCPKTMKPYPCLTCLKNLPFLGLLLLSVSGCSTVIRENIISSINTGMGVTVAENPQTQLYELKAGFIRSQFYSIPTSKTISDASGKTLTNSLVSVSPKETPELVSGIRAASGVQSLVFGMDIAENFAVGPAAVNSRAAIAMYLSQAAKPEAAQAAAQLLTGNEEEETDVLRVELLGKVNALQDGQLDNAGTAARDTDLITAATLATLQQRQSAEDKKEDLKTAIGADGPLMRLKLERFKEKLQKL